MHLFDGSSVCWIVATLLPGTHFAKHVILRLLGVGGATEVYEVIAPDGRRRVLKLIKPDVPLAAKPQARLGQEAEAIAMIEHLNVVRFHDAGCHDDRVWLLIELVEGSDLRKLLFAAGGALPMRRAVSLVRQACEGMAAAHLLGIVHRDLRPENILVTADDMAKVADFGSAKLHRWGVKTTSDQPLLASLLYTAPECLRGNGVGAWSDVYAMGLVLYEALTGAHPIASGALSLDEIVLRQMGVEPPPLASLGLDFPGDLSDLLQRCLAKDPAARPSMRDLADGLGLVLERLNAPRRALARALPLPNRGDALALTDPAMSAQVESALARLAASFEAPWSSDEPSRSALLPPAPPASTRLGASVSWERAGRAVAPISLPGGAATLRSPVELAPAQTFAERERASTSAPVARAPSRASQGPRRRGATAAATVLGALSVLGVIAVEWSVVRAGRGAPASAAAGEPGVVAPVPSGSASGAASVQAAASSASALPARATAKPPGRAAAGSAPAPVPQGQPSRP